MTSKNGKKAGKKKQNIEKKLDIIESNLDTLKKVNEKIKKENEEEEERKKIIDEKVDAIREDLKTQLINQGKFGKQFDDLIEDYIFFVNLKEDLQNDIRTKGLRYKVKTGNGYTTEKPNESVKNLKDINAQMLKMLQDLELKAPDDVPKEGEGDDLL